MSKPRNDKLPWWTRNGEYAERKLNAVEAQPFYAELRGKAIAGMEAGGNTLWFERLLAELGHEAAVRSSPLGRDLRPLLSLVTTPIDLRHSIFGWTAL